MKVKKWILKRSDGQVTAICDDRLESNGNLIAQQIEITEEEIEKAKSCVAIREEKGKLISMDYDHVPVEARTLLAKVNNKEKLTTDEKDELLALLVKKLF